MHNELSWEWNLNSKHKICCCCCIIYTWPEGHLCTLCSMSVFKLQPATSQVWRVPPEVSVFAAPSFRFRAVWIRDAQPVISLLREGQSG